VPPGLGTILGLGIGWVLVYASVANSGRFATRPQAGLFEDAYTGDRSTANFGQGAGTVKGDTGPGPKGPLTVRPRKAASV
jgi:hypothetical protein